MTVLGYNPSCTIDTPRFHGVMRYHFVDGSGNVKGHNMNCPMTETGTYRHENYDYQDVVLIRTSDKYHWHGPIDRMRLWQPNYFCESLNPEVRDYWNDSMWKEYMYAYRGMVHIDTVWRPLVADIVRPPDIMLNDSHGNFVLPAVSVQGVEYADTTPNEEPKRNVFSEFLARKLFGGK